MKRLSRGKLLGQLVFWVLSLTQKEAWVFTNWQSFVEILCLSFRNPPKNVFQKLLNNLIEVKVSHGSSFIIFNCNHFIFKHPNNDKKAHGRQFLRYFLKLKDSSLSKEDKVNYLNKRFKTQTHCFTDPQRQQILVQATN